MSYPFCWPVCCFPLTSCYYGYIQCSYQHNKESHQLLSMSLMQQPFIRTDLFLNRAYEWFKRTCVFTNFFRILSFPLFLYHVSTAPHPSHFQPWKSSSSWKPPIVIYLCEQQLQNKIRSVVNTFSWTSLVFMFGIDRHSQHSKTWEWKNADFPFNNHSPVRHKIYRELYNYGGEHGAVITILRIWEMRFEISHSMTHVTLS